jgi:hypothetical protein
MSIPTFLKKHATAVAHHIIADLIVAGGAGMISWYTAHRAFLHGVSDYVAILIGVGVFFVIAVGYAAIVWAGAIRRTREQKSPAETAQEIDFSPSAIEKLSSEKQSLEEALSQRRSEIASLEKQLKTSQDRLLAHEQLIRTAVDDKAAIKDLVMVCSIEPLKVTDKGAVHLEFRWVFLNMALCDVSVPSIAGFITFHKNGVVKGVPFRIAPTLEEKVAAQNRAFRIEGRFIIQQDFQSSLEADDVLDSSPDSYYDFSNLIVALTGDGFETRLNTNYRVRKNEQWLPRGNGDFIYARLAERDAKIAKLQAELIAANDSKKE